MTKLVLFIAIILNIINVYGNGYNTCDYECSYDSKGKPCKSINTDDSICVGYKFGTAKVCPYGYNDCSKYVDPCTKECNDMTKYKPCISVAKLDKTCYDYIQGFGCPMGTKDCKSLDKKV